MTHEQISEKADRVRVKVEGLTHGKLTRMQLNNIYEAVYVTGPPADPVAGSKLRMEWINKHV